MRSLSFFGVFCMAFAVVGTALSGAVTACLAVARTFTEFIGSAFVRFVRDAAALPSLFAVLDGDGLTPAIAGYSSPPTSATRHEAFVHNRSAARGA